MHNWRDEVLRHFQSPRVPLYVTVDPDGLLRDEQIVTRLKEAGIDLITLDDPVHFRYVYETNYRMALDSGGTSLLVRVLEYETIPYDVLAQGHLVSLGISDIFPNMSGKVLRQLDPASLDALYDVYEQYRGAPSERETLHFLLSRVYKLPYDTIDSEAELWQWLIVLHAREVPLPDVVSQFLLTQLEANKRLQLLPLREWILSQETFYAHLQAEWTRYLQQVVPERVVMREGGVIYIDPEHHPYAAPAVRRLVPDLFIEGILQPIEDVEHGKLPAWTHIGVRDDPVQDARKHLDLLFEKIAESDGFKTYTRYQDWLRTARLYGELKHLYLSLKGQVDETTHDIVAQLTVQLDDTFSTWMQRAYGGLPSLPHLPMPVMVHHIPHYLAVKSFARVALVVLDGMSVVQWAQIKRYLAQSGVRYREHGVFAWVPTVTSVSRQAIFAGQLPLYFADSLWTTNKEKHRWRRFWEDHGVAKTYVTYERGLGNDTYERSRIEALSGPKVKVSGLVVDTIDQLTHGAIQGHEGIAAEIDLWLQNGYLLHLLRDLFDAGFTVFLTADHGNKECRGMGRISDGMCNISLEGF